LTKSAVLIANGEVSETQYVKSIIDSNNFFISIDSKPENLNKLGIKPNLILGDLDTASIHNSDSNTKVIKLYDQSKSDFEKSLDYCISENIRNLYILGATGERDDHNLANIMIAQQYSDVLHIELITNFFQIFFVNGSKEILEKKDRNLSMISLLDDNKITTSGLQYNLSNEKLNSYSHGISNRIVSDKCLIKSEKKLILFIGIE